MYFFTYKTTNILTKDYYIGAHKTINKNDNYLGSGLHILRAIKKYGKQNFIREILEEFPSEDILFEAETKLIKLHLGNPKCYNIKEGGKGGWNYVNKLGLCKGDSNIMRKNPILAKEIGQKAQKTKNLNKSFHDKISIQNLQKAIEKNRGKKRPEHAKKMKQMLEKKWQEDYEGMRKKLASTFLVISPSGEKFQTNWLQKFCQEKKIDYVGVWYTSKSGKPVKKGSSKGWQSYKI